MTCAHHGCTNQVRAHGVCRTHHARTLAAGQRAADAPSGRLTVLVHAIHREKA